MSRDSRGRVFFGQICLTRSMGVLLLCAADQRVHHHHGIGSASASHGRFLFRIVPRCWRCKWKALPALVRLFHVKLNTCFFRQLYSALPSVIVWVSNNLAGPWKRAAGMGFQVGIANLGGISKLRVVFRFVTHSLIRIRIASRFQHLSHAPSTDIFDRLWIYDR
jgi:hypothetical protein